MQQARLSKGYYRTPQVVIGIDHYFRIDQAQPTTPRTVRDLPGQGELVIDDYTVVESITKGVLKLLRAA